MNEFEKQKQEIIDFVKDGHDDMIMSGYEYEVSLVNKIKDLKPVMPTCSTCDKLKAISEEVDYNLVIKRFRCTRKTKSFELNNPYEQSCIYHSDYERTNNG